METCDICKKQIDATQEITQRGDKYVHATCVNKTKTALRIDDSQKKGSKRAIKTTGSVITDIDLPWERVLWVSFQFLVVGLVLAIPVWILVMILFAIAS